VRRIDEAKSIKKLQSDFRLGKGEAEAIWFSLKQQYPLAIDDGPGIKASKVLGIKFLTAIHFMLSMASQNKLSPELAQEKLANLIQYGRYNKRIIQDAMRRLSEGRK